MLENLEDVKLFIEWCKEHKVKSFKIEGVQFERLYRKTTDCSRRIKI
jgi:hypothetical protein